MSLIKDKGKVYYGALLTERPPAKPRVLVKRALTRLFKRRRAWLLFLAALPLALLPFFLKTEPAAVAFENNGTCVVFAGNFETSGQKAFSRRDLLLSTLIVADPDHPLPHDFPGGNTRGFKATVGEYIPALDTTVLRAEALYALCDMRDEQTLDELCLTDGGISYEEQNAMRREAFERLLATETPEDALKKLDAAVPRAGENDHQTGLAIDISLRGVLSYASDDPLLRTEMGRWLNQNMVRFGFIRVTAGCENLHFRFVGRVHATAMDALGLGLTDYLSLVHEQNLVIETGGEKYAVYAVKDEGQTTFPVMKSEELAAGYDNMGYVIITALL